MSTPTTTRTTLIYECGDCGERTTERRCEDCNRFTRRLGAGGNCPHCDEPVLAEELLNPEQLTNPTTPSHTENLTGSRPHQNITDPAHVVAAAELRSAYQARTAATRGPVAATGAVVGQRSLSHYDEVFGLPSPPSPARANLQVVR